MTVLPQGARARGLCRQLLMVILINVPSISLGLAMGWVSLASGEGVEESGEAGIAGARVVVAAATTFLAALVGVPLSAKALLYGRKFAIIATSACFVVCWALKLAGGGWWIMAARVAAGFGGAGAYTIAPLLAREMCEERVCGAASSALILAHNVGFLLMYLAADLQVAHRTVLWACLALAAVHCALFLMVPESPAFLAAQGRDKEATASLAWLRGLPVAHPGLAAELAALPPPETAPTAPLRLFKDMVREPGRRRAFIICFVAVVWQEACGIYTLMQFAERAFVLTRDSEVGNVTTSGTVTNATAELSHVAALQPPGEVVLLSPARQAVILGVVQLVASAVGLYLVEKVGRRLLLVWCALLMALCLSLGAGAAGAGHGAWAGAALAGAVAADNAGLQPAPYALLSDMFYYQYRSCALMLSNAAASAAGALEVAVFPTVAARAGLPAALALSAALTAAYAVFALLAVPDTNGLSPDDLYRKLAPKKTVEDGCDDEKQPPPKKATAELGDAEKQSATDVQGKDSTLQSPDDIYHKIAPKETVEGRYAENHASVPNEQGKERDLKQQEPSEKNQETLHTEQESHSTYV